MTFDHSIIVSIMNNEIDDLYLIMCKRILFSSYLHPLQRWCSRTRRHCGNKVQGKGSAEDNAQDRRVVDAEQGPTQRWIECRRAFADWDGGCRKRAVPHAHVSSGGCPFRRPSRHPWENAWEGCHFCKFYGYLIISPRNKWWMYCNFLP